MRSRALVPPIIHQYLMINISLIIRKGFELERRLSLTYSLSFSSLFFAKKMPPTGKFVVNEISSFPGSLIFCPKDEMRGPGYEV